MLQKSKKSKAFVVHKNKVKIFHGDPPPSWLKNNDAATGDDGTVEIAQPSLNIEGESAIGPITALETTGTAVTEIAPAVAPTSRVSGKTTSVLCNLQKQQTECNENESTDDTSRHAQESSKNKECSGGSMEKNDTAINELTVNLSRHRRKPVHLNDYVC